MFNVKKKNSKDAERRDKLSIGKSFKLMTSWRWKGLSKVEATDFF